MRILYLDEAGCTGRLPDSASAVQPVFVIAGVIVDQRNLATVTHDFLAWKRKFFPRLAGKSVHSLDHIREEVKGADVRRLVRTSRKKRKSALLALGELLSFMESGGVRIVGRIYVKGPGRPFNGRSVYTSSVQALCEAFNRHCTETDDHGVVIADSRDKRRNEYVSHSIFTQKFRTAGDAYERILEMPTFGHSGNHAGIQIADLLCSGILFPMAAWVYCAGYVTNPTHIHADYAHLKTAFGPRLKALQYRYRESDGSWRGGLTVSDGILLQRSGGLLFG